MSVTASPNRLSLLPLMGGLLLAPIGSAAAVFLISHASNWHPAQAKWTLLETVAAGAGCWLMGGVIGVVLMSALSNMDARRLPVAVIVASMVRAGIALFDALAIVLLFKPETYSFWSTFLASGLLCLIIETIWSMQSIRRANWGAGASQPINSPATAA